MSKSFAWHFGSSLALVAMIEFYIHIQSSNMAADETWVKVALILGYVAIAVGTQVLRLQQNRDGSPEAPWNALVGVTITAWLTFSAFAIHPGMAKDRILTPSSVLWVFLRFLLSVGLLTFLLRYLSGVALKRVVK